MQLPDAGQLGDAPGWLGAGIEAMGLPVAGMVVIGQADAVGEQLTVPPGPLLLQSPATPKVSAFTISLFPFVLKLPLSTIPHVGAFSVAAPLMFTPSMALDGGPNVYRQPLSGPPPLT